MRKQQNIQIDVPGEVFIGMFQENYFLSQPENFYLFDPQICVTMMSSEMQNGKCSYKKLKSLWFEKLAKT